MGTVVQILESNTSSISICILNIQKANVSEFKPFFKEIGVSLNHITFAFLQVLLCSYFRTANLLSPTGFFRAYTFWTLSEARSRLYQRRFLRSRAHFSAFFKLYIFSFAPFQISLIFQDLCTIFGKIRCNSC